MTGKAIEAVKKEYFFMLSTPDPVTLIQTIDRIRELREVADRSEANCEYDPEGHTSKQNALLRAAADGYEEQMHERIGWR